MNKIIILERSNKHFSRFIELLKDKPDVKIKDVRKIVAHSSYYAFIIKKIYNLNEVLREINPKLYLAEPCFTVTPTKDVFTCLQRCKLIEIETKEHFFIIKCKNETQNKTHPDSCNT